MLMLSPASIANKSSFKTCCRFTKLSELPVIRARWLENKKPSLKQKGLLLVLKLSFNSCAVQSH